MRDLHHLSRVIYRNKLCMLHGKTDDRKTVYFLFFWTTELSFVCMYASSIKHVYRTISEVIGCGLYWEYLKWICGSGSGVVLCKHQVQAFWMCHITCTDFIEWKWYMWMDALLCERTLIDVKTLQWLPCVCSEIIVDVAQQYFRDEKRTE